MAAIKYTDHKTEDVMRYWFIYNDDYGYMKGMLTPPPPPPPPPPHVTQYLSDHGQHIWICEYSST